MSAPTGSDYSVSFADHDMRHCDATNNCNAAISRSLSTALLWMTATNRIDGNRLSPLGKRVKANILEMFRRYSLAATVSRTGNFAGYVSQLRQALTQGVAACTRLDLIPWFNYMMVTAGCDTWRVALRIPGENPCD